MWTRVQISVSLSLAGGPGQNGVTTPARERVVTSERGSP